jgi:hypothetical protein
MLFLYNIFHYLMKIYFLDNLFPMMIRSIIVEEQIVDALLFADKL